MLQELLTPPHEAQIEIIRKMLKEDTARFENNLWLLERWMDCQEHFPKSYDRRLLENYLRGCKCDMEKTKKKLELFFVCKTTMPDLLSVAKFTKEEMPITYNMFAFPLPKLTQDGARIGLLKLHDSNLDLFDLMTMQRNMWKIAQLRMCKEAMISGDHYIVDCKNTKPIHFTKLMSRQFQKSSFVGLNANFPRIKGVHFINCPSYAEIGLKFFKSLLKPKLRQRVNADVGVKSLLEHFPKECLPSDYGGTEISSEELAKKWHRYLEENEDWFSKWEEVKLIGPIPKDLESKCKYFDNGLQGSFRKLDLD